MYNRFFCCSLRVCSLCVSSFGGSFYMDFEQLSFICLTWNLSSILINYRFFDYTFILYSKVLVKSVKMIFSYSIT